MAGKRRETAAKLVLVATLGLLASACGSTGGSGQERAGTRETPPSARFSATVDHPLVPLASALETVFQGRERDAETGKTIEVRVESRVLERTARVAGADVRVVREKDYENGHLVERTLDYYAQDEAGAVWYFGERVDDYEDGKVVGHGGQWLAGRGDARPGLFMPAKPQVGDAFEQERAPGIAEDRSTVLAVGLRVRTPAGKYSGCIKTKDFAPLDGVTELKYYCPGVGLVREDPPGGRIELVRVRKD
jgi:hypothetical protein